jgi:hypothetical protein
MPGTKLVAGDRVRIVATPASRGWADRHGHRYVGGGCGGEHPPGRTRQGRARRRSSRWTSPAVTPLSWRRWPRPARSRSCWTHGIGEAHEPDRAGVGVRVARGDDHSAWASPWAGLGRPCLVEADPTGGSAIAAGYLRGEVVPPEAMIELALAQQRDERPGDAAAGCRELARVTGRPGSPGPALMSRPQPCWRCGSRWPQRLRSLEATGQDVIVDAGRLGLFGSPEPLVLQPGADLALLVTRTDMVSLSGARSWAETLRDRFAEPVASRAGVCWWGRGVRSGPAKSPGLQLPVVTTVAWDPARQRSSPSARPHRPGCCSGCGPRRLGGLPVAAQLPGGAQRHHGPNQDQRGAAAGCRGGEAVMTSEPVLAGPSPDDPTALPRLFTSPGQAGPGPQDFSHAATGTRAAARATGAAAGDTPRTTPEQSSPGEQRPRRHRLGAGRRVPHPGRESPGLKPLGEDWRARSTDGDPTTGAGRIPMDRTAQEQFGWAAIEDLLSDHTTDSRRHRCPVRRGPQPARPDGPSHLRRGVPVGPAPAARRRRPGGEHLHPRPPQVLLELVDGSRIEGPQVADSDEELIDFLRFLANRSESNPRPFSEGTPRLHMKLDGGSTPGGDGVGGQPPHDRDPPPPPQGRQP